MYVGDFVV